MENDQGRFRAVVIGFESISIVSIPLWELIPVNWKWQGNGNKKGEVKWNDMKKVNRFGDRETSVTRSALLLDMNKACWA